MATDAVVDPVCGEVFPPELATFSSEHDGETIFFCSSTCKETFDEDSAPYPALAAEDA